MFRAILALALAGSASAFVAPKAARAPATVVKANDYSNELGVLPPVGFWDPLGFSKQADQETFDRWRALEIKHGRICQLAVLGYIAPDIWRWSGEIAPGIKFSDVTHGVRAFNDIPSFGWIQMIFLIGAVDYWGVFGNYEVGKVGSTISQGGILDQDEDMFVVRQTQEIQHCRLGMLAFMELLRHDLVNLNTGNDLDHFIIGLPTPY
eukprot:CAMPEP_0172605714 /NCGR_PEP_ID=MMETSP1068-20121228/25914_1 /TAXON_ID=35684 /ORGANISM="Pseudopedinella elastica, Strain CCMP716" /LENGTH=206 /DNA_ID=CAMNT_0013408183 /DNA_START=294 /DNA_END=914 /DNA_ORIENTATION=+